MAVSNALAAIGTEFQRSTDGISYTTIAEITNIGGTGQTREEIDVTHMLSPSDYREFIPSFIDPGEFTLDVNYIPQTHDELNQDLIAATKLYWRILWSDATQSNWTFRAFSMGFNPTAPVADKLAATITIKVSGVIAFLTAAA